VEAGDLTRGELPKIETRFSVPTQSGARSSSVMSGYRMM
jgi:hypothetical protein